MKTRPLRLLFLTVSLLFFISFVTSCNMFNKQTTTQSTPEVNPTTTEPTTDSQPTTTPSTPVVDPTTTTSDHETTTNTVTTVPVTKYVVTFDADNGTNNVLVEVQEKAKVKKPTDPTKEGYTFEGWFLDGATKAFDFNTPIEKNITLKAHWTETKYKVTFNADNGTNNVVVEVKWNTKVTKPSNPTREGFEFLGWYLNNNEYDFNTNVKSNMTLVAHWQQKQAEVFYVSINLGYSSKTDVIEVKNGKFEYIPTRTGYVFSGWYLDSNLLQRFDEKTTITNNDLVLYAAWVEEKTRDDQLDAPKVTLDGKNFSWGKVNNAAGYIITVSRTGWEEKSYETTNNYWSFDSYMYSVTPSRAGKYDFTVSIKAKGDGYSTTNSVAVNKTYVWYYLYLEPVKNLKFDKDTYTVTWDKVDNATGYKITINGKDTAVYTYEDITNNYYELINVPAGNYEITVIPTRTSYTSEAKKITAKLSRLTTPEVQVYNNISVMQYDFVWEKVGKANQYNINIYNGENLVITDKTSQTNYSISANNSNVWKANELKVEIAAFDTNGDYLISKSFVTSIKKYYSISVTSNVDDASNPSISGNGFVSKELTIKFNTNIEGLTLNDQTITLENGLAPAYLPNQKNSYVIFTGWEYNRKDFYLNTDLYEDATINALWYNVKTNNIIEINDNFTTLKAGTVYYFRSLRDDTYKFNYKNTSSSEITLTISDISDGLLKTISVARNSSSYEEIKLKKGHIYSVVSSGNNYGSVRVEGTLEPVAGGKSLSGVYRENATVSSHLFGLPGEKYTLTRGEQLNEAYIWDGWYLNGKKVSSDETIEISDLSSNLNYEARWIYYTLTTSINDKDAGTISTYSKEKIKVGKSITLTAEENEGYTFVGWYDGEKLLTDELSYTFDMPTENVEYEARFTYYTLSTFSTLKYGTFTQYQDTRIKPGTTITLTSRTDNGGEWVGWYENDVLVSSETTYSFVMTESNLIIEARWRAIDELEAFIYSTNAENIIITGIKDKTVTSITIPNSVTSIAEGAFSGCSSLESITLPFTGDKRHKSSDTYQYPFGYIFATGSYVGGKATEQYYYGLSTSKTTKNIYYIPSTLKEVIITDTTYIPYGAFYNCSNITSIIIPNSITSLGDDVFYGCSSLESITLPFIGDKRHKATDTYQYPFGYIFGTGSYDGGKAITQYYYGSSTSSTTSTTYYITSTLKEVIITDMTYMPYGAFYNCSGLTSITLPENLRYISENAIRNCDDIEKIIIPNGVINIGPGALRDCEKITSIVIPNGVIEIGASAFRDCKNLTSITLPNSVTSIANYAFLDCNNLTNVYYNGTIEDWCNISMGSSDSNPMYYASNFYILDDNGDIEYNGNKYSLLTELVIPDTITEIGNYQFSGFDFLTSVTIPNNITSIGLGSFTNCSSLDSITLPFTGDKRHESTDKYQYPFGYIFGTSSYTGGTAIEQNYYGSSTSSTTKTTYYIPSTLKEVIITDTTYIPYGTFYGCVNLTAITVSNKVTSIARAAFSGCSSLESITLPFIGDKRHELTDTYQYPFGYIFGSGSYTGGTSINQSYYGSSTSSTTSSTYYIPSTLKEVIITGTTYIPYGAFYNCNSLTDVTLSNNVTSIGDRSFAGCNSLKNVHYNDTVDAWNSISFAGLTANPMCCASNLYILDATGDVEHNGIKYYLFNDSTELTMPTSLTNIGAYVFPFKNLTSLTIPNSVEDISEGAFSGCSSLESITLPFIGDKRHESTDTYQYPFGYIFGGSSYEGATKTQQYYYGSSTSNKTSSSYYIPSTLKEVIITDTTYIPCGSFYNCSNLTNIIIPTCLTGIGDSVFYNCNNLTSITIPNSVTSIGLGAFGGCSSFETITLPFIGDKKHEPTDTYQYPFGYIFGTSSYTGSTAIQQNYYGSSTSSTTKTTYYIPSTLKEVVITDTTYIPCGSFYNCSNLKSITIPNTIKSIDNYAFYNCSNISNIIIPDSITNIGNYAFYDCTNLISITIPSGVTRIDNYAFYNCSNISNIIIPDSITSIGNYAFYNCKGLENIAIQDSIKSIGEYAFSSCSSLTNVYYNGTIEDWCNISFSNQYSNPMFYAPNFYILDDNGDVEYNGSKYSLLTDITIPESITKIGNYQFTKFDFLTSLTIPNNITSIGFGAFTNCSSLESITLPFIGDKRHESTDTYQYPFGYIFGTSSYTGGTAIEQNYYSSSTSSTTKTTYYIPSTLKEVIITDTTYIPCGAFYNYTGLINIIIPNGITYIDNYALYNCSKLTNLYYNGTIEDWCNISFGNEYSNPMYYASNFYILDDNGNIEYNGSKYSLLTDITIPESITKIGNYQFTKFDFLTSITVPNSVTSIGLGAFTNCSLLESITLPFIGDKRHESTDTYQYPFGYIFGTSSYTGGTAIEQNYYGSSTSSTTKTTYYIPSTLKEVIITDTTYIPCGAFYNCSNLTNIIIPTSVTRIGDSVFYNCSNLTSITIPNSVTTIGDYAFYECGKITTITIPNSVTSIGLGAFGGCSSLESITLPFTGDKRHKSTDKYQYPFGYIFGTSNYEGGIETKQCYYGSSNSSTTTTTYYMPSTIKEVIITDTTYIPCGAFYNCSNISNIIIPDSITSIGSYAFYDCTNLISITMPNSVTSIGDSVFYDCSSLTTITIPNSVKSIGNYVFYNCTSLTNILFEENSKLTSVGNYAFYCCNNITSITIPNSVTCIGDSVFYDCSSLTTITIPNSVKSIGNYAFYNCTSLTNFLFEENSKLTSVGNYAFYCCNNITSITIPNSVTSIGFGAFNGCSSLESITLPFTGDKRHESTDTYQYPFGYIFGIDSYAGGTATNQRYYGPSTSSEDSSVYYIPSTLKEVIITATTYIPYGAFYGCSNLTTIKISNRVTRIAQGAFIGCSSLESITLPFTGDKRHESTDKYQYPFGYIFGTSSYTGGTAIEQNYYGSSTSSTTKTTYYIPSTLKEVIITDTTYIPYGSFYNCSNLTSITIPNSVTSIGSSAFYKCIKLENVYYDGSIEDWCNISFSNWDSNPMNYASNFYLLDDNGDIEYNGNKYSLLTELVIPDTVTEIGQYQFYGFDLINNVYYNGTIKDWCNISIISNPMNYAYNFYLLDDNGDIEYSGNKYRLLTELVIPDTINKIGDNQFDGFNCLRSVITPNSITNIGYDAFYNCSRLTNVYYNGTIKDWCNISFGYDYLNGNEYSNPMYYASNFYILDDNGDIEYNGNKYSLLTELVIPDTITEIGQYQFYGFRQLRSITIPESLISIEKYAFYNCSKLTSIIIPNSVTSIGSYALYNCNRLVEVYNLSSLNIATIYGLNALAIHTSLDEPSILTKDENGFVFAYVNEKGYLVAYEGNDTKPTLPSAFTYNGNLINNYEIREFSFNNCSSITRIIIPNSVTSIGFAAFSGCSSLESITLPFAGDKRHESTDTYQYPLGYIFGTDSYSGGQETYQEYYGSSITSRTYGYYYIPTTLKEVIITDSTHIPHGAFHDCISIKSITISNIATSIADEAFAGCTSLERIVLPFTGDRRHESTDTYQYPLGYIFGRNFTSGEATDQYYYGSSTSSTTSSTYYIPSSLKEVVITDTTYIPYGTFYGCNNITSITIPNSVTFIGSSAFSGCSILTNINLSNNITSIGDNAFFKCSSLTNVYYFGTIEDWCNTPSNSSSSNPMYYAANFYILDANGDIEYNGNKYSLLTELVIPDTITAIENYQFTGFDSLIKVIIPNNITSIGYAAFSSCSSLESITLPFTGDKKHESTDTYQYPFGYIFGTGSYDGGTAVKQYYYGSSTSSTTNTTYYIPSTLKEVVITNTTYIPYGTFYNCRNLTSITIPNSVTSIGTNAFYKCARIASITIPNSVTCIDGWSFFECSMLANIIFEENSTLTSIGDYSFYGCSSLTSITIPNSVTSIGVYAFSSCIKLISILFEENSKLTNIESNAFDSCTRLINITIPNSVTSIGDLAFRNCTTLTSITISEGVTRIESGTFIECSNLTSITIPNSVTSIGEEAFSYCSRLESVIFEENSKLTNIESRTFNYCTNLKNIAIPTSVTSIGSKAFEGCRTLNSISIPNNVTSIGDYAFQDCTLLSYNKYGNGEYLGNEQNPYFILVKADNKEIQSCEIHDKCTFIISSAFYGCINMTGITIPTSVTSIGSKAFYGCSSLNSISIPNNVTSIGEGAFGGCSSLESITLPFTGDKRHESTDKYQYPFGYIFGTNSYFGGMIVQQYYYGSSTSSSTNSYYYIPTTLREVIITDTTYIPYGAFSNCSNLTSVVISNCVTNIGGSAFYNCSNLTSIIIPNGVTNIGSGAFLNCNNLTNIIIPNSVTNIGSSSFLGCNNLTDITIPKSVTKISNYAFQNCNSLTNLYYNGTIKDWCNISFNSVYSNPMYYASNLYILDDNGDIEYNGNKYSLLTELVIPDTVTKIGKYQFYEFNCLTIIIIPKSVTSIESYAFNSCSSLTSITIPDSVTNIGEYAFYGCSALKSIYYGGTQEEYASLRNKPTSGTVYYYSEAKPTKSGNYWHYGEAGVTPIIWVK